MPWRKQFHLMVGATGRMQMEEGTGGEKVEKVERLFPTSKCFQDKMSYLIDPGRKDDRR